MKSDMGPTNPSLISNETLHMLKILILIYQQQYNIVIKDRKQPMLISRAKAKDLRGGMNELMALVPELCRPTGLTDSMKSDFKLTQKVAGHTRLVPDLRIKRLMTFNQRLRSTPESTQVFADWNMELDTKLVEFPGRVIDKQVLQFGNK
jgi:aubergine